MARPRRRPLRTVGRALTAAGFRVRRRDTDLMRRLLLPQSSRSFAYYDLIGEVNYSAQFYARMLGQLELYASEQNADGDWVRSEDPDAVAALDRIQDPGGGGRSGLLEAYGRLMFLTGESYLVVTEDEETGEEQWEFLSTDELRPISGGYYMRYRAPTLFVQEYRSPPDDLYEPLDPEQAVVYRIWQRHPRFSAYATCTMFGVLDIAEELVLLTQAVRARARSRLAGSGILAISDEFSAVPLEPVPDEDATEDPFMDDLVNSMMTAISKEGSASAVVPIVVRGPTEAVKDGIKHIQIIDPTQVYPETGLRMECIKRLAIGLDMPPEQLLGMSDASHWTVWMIDESTWKAHGQPKAQQLCSDLNQTYFQPYLREELGRADWKKFRIAYDAAAVINHPDRTRDAKDLYDREIISKAAVRAAANFDEADAMPKAELAERVGIKTRDSSLAWFGEPAPRGGAVEVAPGEIVSDQAGDIATKPEGAKSGAEVEKGPPPGGPPQQEDDVPDTELIGGALSERELRNAARASVMFQARLMGGIELALMRAREAAGNRIRSYARRNPDVLALLDGVRTSEVAAVLGPEVVRSLKAPDATQLVAGTSDLIADALRLWGVEDPEAARLLAAQVEAHAANTLFDRYPGPLPVTFDEYATLVLRRRT